MEKDVEDVNRSFQLRLIVCSLSHFRPRDGTLKNYFFQIQTHARENEWIIFRYKKNKIPRVYHMIWNGQFTYKAKKVLNNKDMTLLLTVQ